VQKYLKLLPSGLGGLTISLEGGLEEFVESLDNLTILSAIARIISINSDLDKPPRYYIICGFTHSSININRILVFYQQFSMPLP
jgi:hypothetical protein